jgi:hypothetical protein
MNRRRQEMIWPTLIINPIIENKIIRFIIFDQEGNDLLVRYRIVAWLILVIEIISPFAQT